MKSQRNSNVDPSPVEVGLGGNMKWKLYTKGLKNMEKGIGPRFFKTRNINAILFEGRIAISRISGEAVVERQN